MNNDDRGNASVPPAPRTFSARLGAISDAQFQAVADRLRLGRFLSASPITTGLFGQNVFVTTSEGEFVLRGAPHWVKGIDDTGYRQEDRWQFTKERFFAEQLHAHTAAPVPWPMRHDETADLLGWPYLVMPRMPGKCFDERSILSALDIDDRRAVAAALGSNLANMQRLTSPFAGDFSPTTIALEPYPNGYTDWVIRETRMFIDMARAHDAIDADDMAFIAEASKRALAVAGPGEGSASPRPNTFVHGDYKLNNLTVRRDDAGWRVSGVFDLHEARFGDGALDLVRQSCAYLDSEPAMAEVFVGNYLQRTSTDSRVADLMPCYVINDRMKLWEYFSRPDTPALWRPGTRFREWVRRYIDGMTRLVT